MNRRRFLWTASAGVIGSYMTGCGVLKHQSASREQDDYFMSVLGKQPSADMGFTLSHEHLFADVRPYAEQIKNPLLLNQEEVMSVILPHLNNVKKLGCNTLIDCTAVGLGRNPTLLSALSKASGVKIVTTTGAYLSADSIYKPDYFDASSADQLAAKWIQEWNSGIEGTDIKPGMIKIGVNGGPLTNDEKKLMRAAMLTQQHSGLVIGCHVGPWREVKPGYIGQSVSEQILLLKAAKIPLDRWIWIHAQNEVDFNFHAQALQQGAWISYDGYRPDQTSKYIDLITRIKSAGYLKNLLVSQDAGWYTAGEKNGGKFYPFTPVISDLIPALQKSGFTRDDITQIFVVNPRQVFQVKAPIQIKKPT